MISLYLLYNLFLLAATLASASKPPSVDDIAEPVWGPEPKGRGTISIVTSSVVTLGLCVYTALHINIQPNATAGQVLLRKSKFVIMGMIAPEIVLAIAVTEWIEARKLYHHWCTTFNVTPGGKNDNLGMQGAFFVGMGGFSLGPAERFSSFKSIVTYKGFKQFMASGLVAQDSVNKRIIMDKGKAENLGKSLVCLQAIWMLVKCVLRMAHGLPLTLLELHVAMHVVCTVFTYAFWWYKPLDVNEPIPLVEDRELANVLAVKFGRDDCRIRETVLTSDTEDPISIVDMHDQQAARTVHVMEGLYIKHIPNEFSRVLLLEEEYKASSLVRVLSNLGIRKSTYRSRPLSAEKVVEHNQTLIIGGLVTLHHVRNSELNEQDLAMIYAASSTIHSSLHTCSLYTYDETNGDILISYARTKALWTALEGLTFLKCVPAVLIPILYGLSHAIAWNSHFPTLLERDLWRIASVVVGALPSYLILVHVSGNENWGDGRRISLNRVFCLCDYDWKGVFDGGIVYELEKLTKGVVSIDTVGNVCGAPLGYAEFDWYYLLGKEKKSMSASIG